MYSPMIPMEINCTPPRNKTHIMMDAHPGTKCLDTKREYNAYRIKRKEKNETTKPK